MHFWTDNRPEHFQYTRLTHCHSFFLFSPILCQKKSNLIFLFSLSVYEKLSAIKCECGLFILQKEATKGTTFRALPAFTVPVLSCYPIHVPSPALVSPYTSFTCNYDSHIEQQNTCGMCEWIMSVFFNYAVLLLSKFPDFCNSRIPLNIKWHLIIIYGQNTKLPGILPVVNSSWK